MPDFIMTPQEKYFAFANHLCQVDPTSAPFATKYYHPLEDLFDFLDNQIDAFKRYGARPVPFRSVQALKQTLRMPNDPRLIKYDACLRCLVECWGRAANYALRGRQWYLMKTRDVEQQLEACREFACTDAIEFAQCIRPGFEEKIKNRAKTEGRRAGAPQIPTGGIAQLRRGDSTQWNVDHLRRSYNQVYTKRSGECTSFAYSAAYILHRANLAKNLQNRIEVVVHRGTSHKPVTVLNPKWRAGSKRPKRLKQYDVTGHLWWKKRELRTTPSLVTHVFCIVNREGGTEETEVGARRMRMQKLPPASQWGSNCFIVDTWLTSLGWGSNWKAADYPMKSMLENTFQKMDSLNVEAA